MPPYVFERPKQHFSECNAWLYKKSKKLALGVVGMFNKSME